MVINMKKSSQILGLPIISIADGSEVGNVKSLVINPDKGSIDFLTIEKEEWQVSVKAIPYKKVVGIGEYAATIETESAIIDLNEIPIANQLVNRKIKIIGSKVMTRKGEMLGDVQEYYIDEDNGTILGTSINLSGREVTLAADSVITYGKDIIIVKEDASNYFLDTPEELIQDKKTTHGEEFAEELFENDSAKKGTELVEELLNENNSIDEVADFKNQQYQILNGKVVKKDILDNQGNVLLSKGTVLGKAEIEKVQEQGPSIFVELSMNVDVE
ncbi:hypothetical protein M670_01224 [Schinkia azotoformans MEV2011]|uniref:PRC-barrel domain-containing protein n=2 Tax=Schinkia azotoformans TaxID=1454 RepID=A0A072NPP5_SCHAZ|nr:hypothetical protein M670_01224 [Schinkia azotoformans MEV2011]